MIPALRVCNRTHGFTSCSWFCCINSRRRRSNLWQSRRDGAALSDAPVKIGAVGLILAAKRKRVGLAKGAQGLTVDQDRIVGQARVATHRRAAEAFHLTPARQTDQWRNNSTAPSVCQA
jgi:hypothetical protein